ncbi:MAG: Crp/Fnr family transcriptional regulator [Cetobacterium sp.]|uniref:Crp/Fnr family transcriptional regulator n=1 Tax=Cetobacterium sp. TaxID=2071632 RepID=UPI003F2AF3D5
MLNLKVLEKVKIFKGLKSEELIILLQSIDYKIKKFEKNDSVLFRGDKLDGIFIILQGSLSAEMLKNSGDIQKIENLSEGDIIASAFIFGEKNNIPVDLIALEKCCLLHIDKKNLLKTFKIEEKILINFLDEISDKTQFLSNKVWKSFNTKTIKEKILDYISENTIENKVVFKHSIKELSELFGVSRPSLSRVISEFIEEGILEREEKKIFRIKK